MKILQNPDRSEWDQLCHRPIKSWTEIESQVRPVLDAVREKGDKALKEFTFKWDNVNLTEVIVPEIEIKKAIDSLNADLKESIQVAYENILKFHLIQKDSERIIETMPGVLCWQKSVAIERVGLYIPGGTAPLFSTVLMLAIPAQIAGCSLIELCTPPQSDGTIHPAILYAASLAGVHKIIKVGGAQAIAGFIFGTSSVDRVDKIFGPGNQYVTAAKQLALQEGVAIDLPAGPSEVLIIIDNSSDPAFVAADLLAQAEHGMDSQVVLLAQKGTDIQPVLESLEEQLENLPRKHLAEPSIKNSLVVVFDDISEIIDFCNYYAPEHLIIATNEPDLYLDKIVHAGSVFVGQFTPESVGDYASGTNHTLPTNRYARNYSGVNLDAFVKKITFQKLTKEGIKNIGPHVVKLAQAEELEGHAKAVQLRLDKLKK